MVYSAGVTVMKNSRHNPLPKKCSFKEHFSPALSATQDGNGGHCQEAAIAKHHWEARTTSALGI